MLNWKRYCEWTLNGLSLILLAIVVGLLLKRIPATDPGDGKSVRAVQSVAGEALEIPSIQWNARHPSLVLALSVNCVYCRQSLPFYRNLKGLSDGGPVRVIALLPEPEDLATAYLRTHGVHADVVRQVDLATIGVAGTPTLILADENGRILRSWAGRLSATQEAEVLKQVAIKRTAPLRAGEARSETASFETLGVRELIAAREQARPFAVVDTRERRWFNTAHIVGSLNIPLDELAQRAIHEVPRESTVVLFCGGGCDCKRNSQAAGVQTLCSVSVILLRSAGFKNVRVLDTNIEGLRSAGVPLESSSSITLPRLTIADAGRRA